MTSGSKEPRSKRRRIGELFDPVEDRDPHLLLHVLGVITEHATQIAERAAAEEVEETRERALVARLTTHNEQTQTNVLRFSCRSSRDHRPRVFVVRPTDGTNETKSSIDLTE